MKTENRNICRVCLGGNEEKYDMKSIFDVDEENIEISTKLGDCSGLIIKKEDNFPIHICIECNKNLQISFQFRKLCQITEKKLRINYDEKQVEDFYVDRTIKLELIPHIDYSEELTIQEIDEDNLYNTQTKQNQTDLTIENKTKIKCTKSLSDNEKTDYDLPKSVKRKKLKGEKEKLFICEICGNFYNKKYQLRRHRELHTDVMNFECEICHKKFRQNNYLARHMRCHTGQKPHECKYCDRCFSDLSTKIKHERLHTGEKPFKCDTCGKSFTYSDVLKKHLLVHTGEKPFSCELCGSSFSRKHHLTTHYKSLMHLSKLK